MGEAPQRFQVLQGLYRFYVTQARLHAAGELAQEVTELAHRQLDAGLVREGLTAARQGRRGPAAAGGDLQLVYGGFWYG